MTDRRDADGDLLGGIAVLHGVSDFWEMAMRTLALLGTAACLSIVIGIALGMFAVRRPEFYAAIQLIMDFMQTMPAFIFMISVIGFSGTGKPAAVVTTMTFGGTPAARLTVLALRGVPEKGPRSRYLVGRKQMVFAHPC